MIRYLNTNYPRTVNSERRVALAIELKHLHWYKRYLGLDPAKEIFELLERNNIETIDKSKNDIPTII